MKRLIRVIAMGTLVAFLGIVVGSYWKPVTAEARTWPDNVYDWTDEDWYAYYNYYNAYINRGTNYQQPVWYNNHYYYWDGANWYYIGEDGRIYYDSGNNNYTNNNGYNQYNYYNGIVNLYDESTEYQAQILAKIIYLYGHGVASLTQQACIGWAVMNSVDASPSGTDIGAVAPNFHYDASKPTVDDFGRDLMPLARDIIFRWKAGRAGVGNNGRVIPQGYCWVWSTGNIVVFRNTPNESGAPWTYNYSTPYGS